MTAGTSTDGELVVKMEDATVRRGPDEILSEVNLTLPRGARAVVVGPNGCGKTTLLSVIAGTESVETGALSVSTESMGWLRQEAVSGSSKTVYDEAVSEMEATAAGNRLAEAEAALAAATEGDSSEAQEAYHAASEEFESLGGYQIGKRAERVLTGLNFAKSDFERPVSELSGGWQMRVALARALLRDPELLLLDEPTNHMDSNAKNWLASYLHSGLSPDRTLLLVTHDKSLLDEMRCTSIIEISAKQILQYDCSSIQQWEENREMRMERLEKQLIKLQRESALDKTYIAKWGSKSSHATLAQSRKKKMDKRETVIRSLKEAMRGLPEDKGKDKAKAKEAGTLPLASPNQVRLLLPAAPLANSAPIDGVLLGLQGARVGYEDGTSIIGGVDLSIGLKMRVALLGPNGCGKSTLLRTLAGTLEVQAGDRRIGAGGLRRARVALFTQDLAQDLPADQTPVEYVTGDGAPIMLGPEGARRALGALGLRSEAHLSKIGVLSGGEKARVALAVFTTRPADVLLLDEPTNHLDGAAVMALSQGLREHQGAVIVASHDMAFVDELQVTHTANVTRAAPGHPGSLQLEEGPPKERPAAPAAGPAPSAAPAAPQAPKATGAPAARRRRRSMPRWKAVNESTKLMSKIEAMETELQEAEQEMLKTYSRESSDRYASIQEDLAVLYERWEELEV